MDHDAVTATTTAPAPAAEQPVSPLTPHAGERVAAFDRPARWALRCAVLAAGSSTMALQMCATRLLAPWVGGSTLVWAVVIGCSLVAMSTGYVVGGRLADRAPDGRVLARLLGIAAVLVAAVPFAAPAVLRLVTGLVDPAGGAVAVAAGAGYVVLVAAPAVVLGTVPPFVIRLALVGWRGAGRTAGGIYALSTVGSIVGTLGSVLVLLQLVGTRWTLAVTAVLLALGALVVGRIRPVGVRGDEADGAADGSDRAHAVSGAGAAAVLPIGVAIAIVAFEGVVTMTVEMGAARLVAPFYGASTVVWANLIGVVLTFIAVGSWLGGRVADRWPTRPALATVMAAGAAAVALLPFVAAPVMRIATGGIDEVAVGAVVGSFLASMALLAVPVTLLGMVPPVAIKLALAGVEGSGRVAGRLYAASTGGALVGTFGSVLVLVPAVGTRRTLLAAAAVGALAALALAVGDGVGRTGTGERARRGALDVRVVAARGALVPLGAAVLVAVLALVPTGTIKPRDGYDVTFEGESRYQYVQVVEEPGSGRRLLQLNEGWAVHSVYDPGTVLTGGIWDHFLVLPTLTRGGDDGARRVLVVGNAAGTAARAYAALRPRVAFDGVELDPLVTEVGRDQFAMDRSGVRVHAADGRPFLAGTTGHWDAIHVDAYRQPYIPFYLTTREFFRIGRGRLAHGGVLSINVGAAPGDDAIIDAVAATMRDVFPTVVRYRAEEYNELVVGFDDHLTRAAVVDRLERFDVAVLADGGAAGGADPDAVSELVGSFAHGVQLVEPAPDLVLTDDHAPVEWLTDRMILTAAQHEAGE